MEGKPLDTTVNWFDDINTPKGAETATAFIGRIHETVCSILTTYECPLLVSHGGVFMVLAHLLKQPNLRSPNGIPFYFKPLEVEEKWDIKKLIS